MSPFRRLALAAALVLLPSLVAAQQRIVELRFTPAKRMQMAIWVERDGSYVGTLLLTEAVALRGIGNRPGALQMNSGFRWPYGRREGVLPVWAHRRASLPDAPLFRMVIFQDRVSEGYASRTSTDSTRDNYFCLSFNDANNENVDAVSCASVFNSDKGRYLTQADATAGYHEPFATSPSTNTNRALGLHSLYPPRRDVTRGPTVDHADVAFFNDDARAVMPEIDAITRATFPADQPQVLTFLVPDAWPNGTYVVRAEVSTERDHNTTWSESAYPTPTGSAWDTWAINTGYAYRGQPSVVYDVPIDIYPVGGTWSTSTPAGYGEQHGLDGNVRPMDATISNDPASKPGSGADRLRQLGANPRLSVRVVPTSVCEVAEPPPECSISCGADAGCPEGFLCGSLGTCVGYCDIGSMPAAPETFAVIQHPDEKRSHEWVRLSFVAPTSRRRVARYDVRVSTTPITDALTFEQAENAKAASTEFQGVTVCPTDPTTGEPSCPAPGTTMEVDVGKLLFQTSYHVAIRAIDDCGQPGPIATATIETTEIHFTTVSPCFVATAAYGSPMAPDVNRLRRFRDTYLMPHGPGRAFVAAYYAVGPHLADVIQQHELLRLAARIWLAPAVTSVRVLQALEGE